MRSQNISDYTGSNVNSVAKKTLFSDLDASFKRNVFTSDLYLKKDLEAVKSSIINIVLTGRYERPFQPDFGGNIRSFLFDNIDDNIIDSMRDVIMSAVSFYEPRANVLDVSVNDSDVDNNTLRVTIQFSMKSTGIVAEVSTLLERIR